ncbi:hypothetical protein KKJ06_15495 [Xenorhabdus bovienii]|uniref:Uncharacterized protein n=2 Tax=Xenorhabdus bovienii TaxID=40576 RepID=A0A077PFZ0_XENBV|nr:hypothetical protein [Xenorhabdus bovienii]MDE1485439.1 hypothetical protein [Xenorhabdus bovienii]MDE1493861.1 hypothetical protein [Xenorhabdus bovienii]MDE9445554.1 hypothetical protein [Xenorhabdus bovienii]MDE9453510.1 hypothetical protein [Xenorhabdus bovienii]MDE9471655.1 hypothetical protein [Xenorhabdus bovienii]
MLNILPTSILVKTLPNNKIGFTARNATTVINFEPLDYTSEIGNTLILAGQALITANSNNAPGPFLIEYETRNGLNFYVGMIIPIAEMP